MASPGTDVAPGDAGMVIRPKQYTMMDKFNNAGCLSGAVHGD